MARRQQLLDFAVLGLLHEDPMHGYELRRRLNESLGSFRALSFGTLYPRLRALLADGLIAEENPLAATAAGKRPRIVYSITQAGRTEFADMAARADAGASEDDGFDVRVAFFARTRSDVRLRILEARRARLEQRLEAMRPARTPTKDSWNAALAQRKRDAADREIRWLTELIDIERAQAPTP